MNTHSTEFWIGVMETTTEPKERAGVNSYRQEKSYRYHVNTSGKALLLKCGLM